MTKRKSNRLSRPQSRQLTEKELASANPEPIDDPVPKKYTPPECSLCVQARVAAGKEDERYAEVTHTVREGKRTIRRLRCRFCGNRWKHVVKTLST